MKQEGKWRSGGGDRREVHCVADQHILYFPIDPYNCSYYTYDLFIWYLFIQNSGPSHRVPKEKKKNFARKIQTCQLAGESVQYCFGSLHYSARRDVVVTRLYIGLDLSPGSQTSLVCHSRCLLPWCFDRLYSSFVVFFYLYFTTVHV